MVKTQRERAAEEVSQPVEFQEDFMEERAPRSCGNKQREEALCILSQRQQGTRGFQEEWGCWAGAGGPRGGSGWRGERSKRRGGGGLRTLAFPSHWQDQAGC